MKRLLELLFWFAVPLVGCGQSEHYTAAPEPQLSVASQDQCPAGGTVVTTNGETAVICNGVNGANGTDGISPSSISVVQFCSGTAQYPSTFMEVGLCIDHQLYGVYSANNGFLTLLPPGVYASNAIGNSCTFTVLPDCQVQQ